MNPINLTIDTQNLDRSFKRIAYDLLNKHLFSVEKRPTGSARLNFTILGLTMKISTRMATNSRKLQGSGISMDQVWILPVVTIRHTEGYWIRAKQEIIQEGEGIISMDL